MKKPKNFDKLNKIKFSDVMAHPYTSIYTNTSSQYYIGEVTIYNADETVYNKKAFNRIVLVNEFYLHTNEIVVNIHWEVNKIRFWAQPIHTWKTKKSAIFPNTKIVKSTHQINFLPSSARTMEQFIVLVLYEVVKDARDKGMWNA
jgi:hypothetical protein